MTLKPILITILSILAIGCILWLLLGILVNYADAAITWDSYTDEQIVKAIYQAEGGSRATFAYGIRSIKYSTISDARRICLNSVRNGRKRWIKAGKPNDLIIFVGKKYCPPKAHRLNSNWVFNVKYFLVKE